ncbi:hypothetical protein A2U01_0103037, partial [Trifolium medium]|nr:hypothetical protein [Trifolium medium]
MTGSSLCLLGGGCLTIGEPDCTPAWDELTPPGDEEPPGPDCSRTTLALLFTFLPFLGPFCSAAIF